ncbi:PaaI family thioesterase [Microtetraspora malaysiensis]|uniref:PaaI family thioesterase n=1 Tax=Microtetraspora malaysiensis TaxID=161358 RepID=UPI003D939F17
MVNPVQCGPSAPRAIFIAELRRVLDAAVCGTADDARLPDLTAKLAEIAAALEAGPACEPRYSTADWARFAPVAPALNLRIEDGAVRAAVRLGTAQGGPSTVAHGGTVAAILDHVMAAQMATAGQPGVTTDLQVTYRRPTPLHTDLTVCAGHRLIDDRKVRVWAELEADGELTAEATATFVTALRHD